MKHTQFIIVVLVVFILCFILGCVTPKSSGVFPTGKDTYTVVITGVAGHTMGELMKQAYQEANSFCETKRKVMQPVATFSQPYPPSPYPYFELKFQSLDPDDPQYHRPVLETAPDTKIEIRK